MRADNSASDAAIVKAMQIKLVLTSRDPTINSHGELVRAVDQTGRYLRDIRSLLSISQQHTRIACKAVLDVVRGGRHEMMGRTQLMAICSRAPGTRQL